MDRFLRKKDFHTSAYAGRLVGDFGSREIMPRALFEKMTTLTFEGECFSAVADYDAFLTALYGDYMTLPPVEKQVTHHEFEAYRVNA
jgi:lipopolysaccharide cholinephosphotransferase